jgi:amidohydrolase
LESYISEAQDLFNFTRELRREIHRHPELGFEEVRTAELIEKELNEIGLEVRTGIAETGVVAVLHGEGSGPIVLARFDMDALPITEETGASYASVNNGVMHACGHDGHVAIGLTVARILSRRRKELNGSVKFVFQPAEEGLGGAKLMVDEGVLDDPKPDVSLALHLWNEKPVGWLGITSGPAMAASETFRVRVTGKGGHGAAPHYSIDPILTAAQVICALQSIVSRNVPPLESAVVTITSIHGGEAFNVIPPEVVLKGTIRTFDSSVRDLVLQRFREIVTGVAQTMGCSIDLELSSITPAVINDATITNQVQNVASSLLPEFSIHSSTRTMGSEDMAYMMEDIPGCYFFVGSSNAEKELDASHHHPRFDFDEDVLPYAAGLMAASVASFL